MVALGAVFLSLWQLMIACCIASDMHLASYSGLAWDIPDQVYNAFDGRAENTASSGYSEWYCLAVREQFRQSLKRVLVAPKASA